MSRPCRIAGAIAWDQGEVSRFRKEKSLLRGFGIIKLLRLALVLALAGTLLLALTPLAASLPIARGWDKLNHAFAFMVLALLCSLAYPQAKARYLASLLLAFGAAIEILQAIPVLRRTPEFGDILADAAGIAIGFAVINLLRLAGSRLSVRPALDSVTAGAARGNSPRWPDAAQ